MQVVLERRTNISVWFYACVFADETGDKEAEFFFGGGARNGGCNFVSVRGYTTINSGSTHEQSCR